MTGSEKAEDERRVLLFLCRKAIERVECIGSNGMRKLEARLLVIIFEEVELHDPRTGLQFIFCAIFAAVICLRSVVSHHMRIDSTPLSLASTISYARMVDEEEAWLLICVLGSSHVVRCEAGWTPYSGLRRSRSRVVEYFMAVY